MLDLHSKVEQPNVTIDPLEFRHIMRRLATGVTIVTARSGAQLHGMTANTFTSISLKPTLVLISVKQESRMHGFITLSGHYAVNVLSTRQAELAKRFAHQIASPADPFADIAIHVEATGAPIIDDCITFVDCRVAAAFDVGDHTLFIGHVLAMGYGHSKDADPLLFLDGNYTTVHKH